MAAAYVEDVLLVDRCLTGEPAATRELFRKHRGRVHASLYRVLGTNRDMDDLLQEAFIQVFQSLRGWRAEASLSTWIDRVAVRCAYRYLSQKGRRIRTEEMTDEDVPGGEATNANRQLARDGVKRLYAVLDDLGAASRLAFTLHEIDGRPLAEVAKLVGSSVTATKLRVWRARKKVEEAALADPVLSEFVNASGSSGNLIELPKEGA
ncbi:MAG TPA: RNA polymerase sigma factor [Kofleriaceae bacterium]|nr:RNA polymerase sigma factor [Kofleriaceae bacterium]